jgi:hypothetical protein
MRNYALNLSKLAFTMRYLRFSYVLWLYISDYCKYYTVCTIFQRFNNENEMETPNLYLKQTGWNLNNYLC